MRDPQDDDTPAATIGEVAARAGVSIATVSRVMNGVANKASPATIAKVRRVVAELGYRPQSAGRTLRQRTSRLVAVLAANLANPTMAAIAATAETALRERGLVMVLCDTHDKPELQDEYLLEMRAHRARVIVLLGAVPSPGLSAMHRRGDPLLFVNRRSPDDPDLPVIGIDNRAAGADVADYLATRVTGAFAVVHGALHSSATADRVAGFLTRAVERGRPIAPDRVLGGVGDHLDIGYRAFGTLLSRGDVPAAILCTSDLLAYGVHRRAREAGLAVPDDLVVIGFDGNPLNVWVAPWLASVEVPYAAFGPAIARAADAIGRGAPVPRPTLPHRLVVPTA